MAKRGRKPKVKVAEEAKQETPRVRQRGDSFSCAVCGADMFVENSKAYPGFLRVRHYKCSECGRISKQSKKDTTL